MAKIIGENGISMWRSMASAESVANGVINGGEASGEIMA
jgi:hypothetical protein